MHVYNKVAKEIGPKKANLAKFEAKLAKAEEKSCAGSIIRKST